MTLYKCPNCNDPSKEFDVFPSKEKYRWYEFARNRSSCRHCGAEVGLDGNFQKWGLLILPAIVILIWDAALINQGGVNEVVEYASLVLASLGFVMLYVKRKMIVIKPPSNKNMQSDAAKPRH